MRLHWTSAYWLALLLVVCLQAAWWLHFLILAVTRSPRGPVSAINDALKLSSEEYLRRMRSREGAVAKPSPADVDAFHQQLLAVAHVQRQEAMVLGALGLAAWAAIAAASAGLALKLNDAALRLLLVGVISTLAGPVLFSRAGTRTTQMGLQSLVVVGYDAIVLWLAYAVAVVFGPGWHAVGILVVVAVVARESVELASRLRQNGKLFRRPGPQPPARRRTAATPQQEVWEVHMSAVKWPGNAYDAQADDLSAPMQQLLQDLNLLEGEGTVRPWGTPPSLQVITAGGTALSKGWAAFVGLFGGGGAVLTALQGFGADPQDEPLQRAVFVASAAVILATAVIAIAVIVRADVAARAEATAAEYGARAHVANALLNSFQYGRPLPVPVREERYFLRRKDAQGRVEPKWHPVVGFEFDEGKKELVALVDGGVKVPDRRIAEWVTGTEMKDRR